MSEKNIPVTAKIGVDDDTSGPLARITARLNRLSAPGHRIGEAFKGVGESLKGLGEHLEDIVKPAAALTAAFSLGGIIESTKHFIEVGAAVADTATKLGISAQALDEWNYAASQSGVSSDDLQSSIGRLNRNLVDVASGKNKDLPRLLSRLGISVRDSAGHMKTADQLLPELADGFTKLHTPIANNALAIAAFGKNGPAMIQLMKEGSRGFGEMAAKGRELGVVQTDLQHEMAKEADDAIGRLSAAFDGLGRTIGSAVTPAILPLIETFTDWIAANRELIGQNIGDFVKGIGDELKQVDWDKIGSQIGNLVRGVAGFVDSIGGWKTAIGGLLVVMNAGLIGSIINVGMQISKLGLLVASNPILLIGAAIAGTVYLIYKNWDGITAYFSGKFESVKQAFSQGFIGGVEKLLQEFDPIQIFADGINGAIKYLFGIDLISIGNKWIGGFIDAVKAKLSGMFDGIGQSLSDTFGFLTAAPATVGGRSASAAFAPRAPLTLPSQPSSAAALAPLPRATPQALALASGGGGASAGAAAGGQIGVVVDFKNMPQGVQAQATTAGPSIGRVEVGKSRQGAL